MLPGAISEATHGNAVDSTNPQKLISQDLEGIYLEPYTSPDHSSLLMTKTRVHNDWLKLHKIKTIMDPVPLGTEVKIFFFP